MQQIKIEKRITEELDGIRKLAALLPPGKANALINKCNKISGYARKAQGMVDAPVGVLFPRPVHADYDARTQEDMAAQAKCKEAVFQAMKAGRKISIDNSREFKVGEMHTVVCCIRKDIDRKDLPWIMCDEWVRLAGRRPFKNYWLIPKDEIE